MAPISEAHEEHPLRVGAFGVANTIISLSCVSPSVGRVTVEKADELFDRLFEPKQLPVLPSLRPLALLSTDSLSLESIDGRGSLMVIFFKYFPDR